VMLTVKSGGLTITAQGRALSDGRRGDIVRVVATPTNRTLDGAVEGPGAVRIAAN
jgi:flagellar basal body P-ring formation protein FlgA